MTRAECEALPSLKCRPQERRCSLLSKLGGGGEAQGWERGGQKQRGRRLGSGVAWTARSRDSKARWSEPNLGGALAPALPPPGPQCVPGHPQTGRTGGGRSRAREPRCRGKLPPLAFPGNLGALGRGWSEGPKAWGHPQAGLGLRTEPPAAEIRQ